GLVCFRQVGERSNLTPGNISGNNERLERQAGAEQGGESTSGATDQMPGSAAVLAGSWEQVN
ncbi:Hypothetical predicted protein, partial [Podarcis lilfordi]